MYIPVEHGLDPRVLLRARDSDALPFPMSAPRHMYFHRARNAIYHLFRALGFDRGQTVLVPDYHNGNEVQAIRAAGAHVRFYRVDRNLEIDLEHLGRLVASTHPAALFVIHYFGWPQPIKALLEICERQEMLLVEDCALSLLSETLGRPLGSFGDYSTFCLYKTLPVPNGGVLVQNRGELPSLRGLPLEPCGLTSVAGRTFELLFERFRARAYGPGQAAFGLKRAIGRGLSAARVDRVPFGDIGFDWSSLNVAAAPLSLSLLRRFDYDAIRQRRRENMLRLTRRLEGFAPLLPRELESGTVPLLFPLLVPDKHAAAVALGARGVVSGEYWNTGDPETEGPEHADSQFLHEHLLELPIHQDITPDQVEYMADQVLELRLHY